MATPIAEESAPAVATAPSAPMQPSPFELWLSGAIGDAFIWLRGRVNRVPAATRRRLSVAAIGGTTGIVMWAIWQGLGPPATRRAERDFITAHCDNGTPFADCQALVSKRNAEAHEVAAAVTAHERKERAVSASWVPASSTGFMMDRVGDVGVLTETTPIFLARGDFEESIILAVANDSRGYNRLARDRAMLGDTSTHVRILETSSRSARRVRIEDGPFAGESGWMTMGVIRSR